MKPLVTDPAWSDGLLFIALIPIAMVAVLAYDAARHMVRRRLEQQRLRRVIPGAVVVSPKRRSRR